MTENQKWNRSLVFALTYVCEFVSNRCQPKYTMAPIDGPKLPDWMPVSKKPYLHVNNRLVLCHPKDGVTNFGSPDYVLCIHRNYSCHRKFVLLKNINDCLFPGLMKCILQVTFRFLSCRTRFSSVHRQTSCYICLRRNNYLPKKCF